MTRYKTTTFRIPASAEITNDKSDIIIALLSSFLIIRYKDKQTYYEQNSGKYDDIRFVNISSKVLRKFVGRNYSDYVQQLISSGVIVPFISSVSNTASYRAGDTKENSFCKLYRFNDILNNELRNEQYKQIDLKIINIRSSSPKEINSLNDVINNEHTPVFNNKFSHIINNLNQLTISEDVFDDAEFNPFDSTLLKYIEGIYTQDYSISESDKGGRIYHNVIMMKSELRKYIQHKSNEELTVLDLASANPTFLAYFITDPVQKIKWLRLVNNGNFYTELMGADVSDKQIYKSKFMAAMSGKDLKGKIVNAIREKINTNFPSLQVYLDKIHTQGKTICAELGKIETKIIRDTFKDEKLFNLSMHDGLLVKTSDVKYFIKKLQLSAQANLGYPLTITKESMNYKHYDEAGDLLALIPDNKFDAQELLQKPYIDAIQPRTAILTADEAPDVKTGVVELNSPGNYIEEFDEYLVKPKNDLESTLDDLLDFSDLTETNNLTVVKQEVILPVQQENKTSEVKTETENETNKSQIYNILKNAKNIKTDYKFDQYSKEEHNKMVRIKSNLNMISFKLKQFPKLQPMYNELVRWFTVECKRLNSIETINNRKLKCISY